MSAWCIVPDSWKSSWLSLSSTWWKHWLVRGSWGRPGGVRAMGLSRGMGLLEPPLSRSLPPVLSETQHGLLTEMLETADRSRQFELVRELGMQVAGEGAGPVVWGPRCP